MFGCNFIFYYFLSSYLGVILSQLRFFQPNSAFFNSIQIYSTHQKKKKKKNNPGVVVGPPPLASGVADPPLGFATLRGGSKTTFLFFIFIQLRFFFFSFTFFKYIQFNSSSQTSFFNFVLYSLNHPNIISRKNFFGIRNFEYSKEE
jgi:hypothetical protein